MQKPFLEAVWSDLILANYVVPPEWLLPHLPAGTELDLFNGRSYVSLVGFLFLNTRVRGLAIPGHINFEEVNLRFYVKREVNGETRRAVVFIREIVPRLLIAKVANWLYEEPYFALPMRHAIQERDHTRILEYGWGRGFPYAMRAEVEDEPQLPEPGSEAHFIVEHYWGYTKRSKGPTSEYRVAHPPWLVWNAASFELQGDFVPFYGQHFGAVLQQPPESVVVAKGSSVEVYPGQRLKD